MTGAILRDDKHMGRERRRERPVYILSGCLAEEANLGYEFLSKQHVILMPFKGLAVNHDASLIPLI